MRAAPYLLVALGVATAQAEDFSGRVVRVHSGDSLTVLAGATQVRVRLDGIDAPELRQPFGKRSRQSLVDLCAGTTAQVAEKAKEPGRIRGAVACAGVDASHEQVRRGMAWVSARGVQVGSPLYEFESYARLRKIGLWADPEPVAPWIWREQQRKTTQ